MRNYLIHITLILSFGFSACGKPSTSENTNQSPANIARPRVESTDTGVKSDIAQFAVEAKGKVGVEALNLETGEYFSLNGDGHYPLQSVYKLPISLAVVSAFERDHRDLDEKVEVVIADMVRLGQYSPIRDKYPNGTTLPVRELIRYALEESDGTASDVLMRVLGGPERVQAYLGTLRITDMKVVNGEKELGANWQTQYANWSTPAAAVDLLEALYGSRAMVSDNGRQMILQMMTNSTPGKDRIRGLLGDAPVAHKTGTSGTQDGLTAATNDIGIVTLPSGKHFAIAVFVSDSTADDKTRAETIAKITKVLWDYWQR